MFPLRDNIPARTWPVVNYLLVAICGAVFFLQLSQRADRVPSLLVDRYGMIPLRVLKPHARLTAIRPEVVQTVLGPVVRERPVTLPLPSVPAWLTLLTCLFLHGGWMHLLGNMWFLLVFGDNVEDRLGHTGYLLFYLGCGVVASLAHLLSDPSSTLPTVGASGAIAGVMGAYFVLYPRARVLTLVPVFVFIEFLMLPAPIFLGLWFGFQFLSGAVFHGAHSGGVAWWAHIGGFAVGLAVVVLLKLSGWLRPPVRVMLTRPPRRGWSV